jgi:8-oxo-dGTP pyrophosphatase MutT (NUDIX family)
MPIDVGTAEQFYGPHAPRWEQLKDAIPGTQRFTVAVCLEDGTEITSQSALHVIVSHPELGSFRYGQDISGRYDTVHWLDRGGSAKILYALIPNHRWRHKLPFVKKTFKLYVGLMLQSRSAQILGESVYEIPRGFREEGESPIQTAQRELLEEVGLEIDPSDIEPLGVGNGNNTFLLGCATKFFGVRVKKDLLVPLPALHSFYLRSDVLKNSVKDRYQRQKEGIEQMVFMSFVDVGKLVEYNSWKMGSMPMLSAIGLLTLHLSRLGISWE